MKPLKIMFLAPHLSTGGMPAFLLKRIEALKQYTNCEIFVIEYNYISMDYTVQRTKIIQAVGPINFHTLKWENKCDLFMFIEHFNPDIIHIDEMVERLSSDMIKELYTQNRTYKIVETCHDISFNPNSKIYNPDAYAFCTKYHLNTFSSNKGYREVIEFPIDKKEISEEHKKQAKEILGFFPYKKHVINIGLWTPGKNQAEGIEIARKYPKYMFHFIGNQAENFKDYWEPLMKNLPENVIIWGEQTKIELFLAAADIFMFNSINECNPIVLKEAISYELPIFAHNLPQYLDSYDSYISPINSLKTKLYNVPTNNTSKDFALNHIKLYENVLNLPFTTIPIEEFKIIEHFVDGPFVEIVGTSDSEFKVEFWDKDKDILIHRDITKINHWVKASRKYYTNWTIRVYKDDKLVYGNSLNYIGKRVFIAIDSSALGDTLAWVPYAEEFRYKHKCKLILSTFHNELFKDKYPHIEFVSPGETVHNLYGMYTIGWHYDSNKEPILPNTLPLQAAACNILGLEYKEIKPLIKFKDSGLIGNYVTIATSSTSGCKTWPKENWQIVINYLTNLGYNVINVSSEKESFDNCQTLKDTSLSNTIKVINESIFFIGLSSGLSWLAWALNKKTIMIANFTEEMHEFSCYRPIVKTVCSGCWNNANFKFDKGDWNWCPIHKGTDRQFECQKAITVGLVLKKIKTILMA